jgi:hypothetical protein
MRYGFPGVQSSCSYACAWKHIAALQDTEHTLRRLAQLRSMKHGQRRRKMSRSFCRTVFTVSLLFLETKCHNRWVRSYMQPSPTKSCISTSFTLGCQEMGSISSCYFSRMTLANTCGLCRFARLMLQLLSTHCDDLQCLVSCCYGYRTEAATSRTKLTTSAE